MDSVFGAAKYSTARYEATAWSLMTTVYIRNLGKTQTNNIYIPSQLILCHKFPFIFLYDTENHAFPDWVARYWHKIWYQLSRTLFSTLEAAPELWNLSVLIQCDVQKEKQERKLGYASAMKTGRNGRNNPRKFSCVLMFKTLKSFNSLLQHVGTWNKLFQG